MALISLLDVERTDP